MSGARLPFVAVITAAGSSRRFGGIKKELALIDGRSVLDHAVSPFLELDGLLALVITAPSGLESEIEASLAVDTLDVLRDRLGPSFRVVAGGPTRRDSVRLGLEAADSLLGELRDRASAAPLGHGAIVLVHDGARPFLDAALILRVAETAAERGACVPVTPLVDTPKSLGPGNTVAAHPARSSIGSAQTPQGFLLAPLLAAHRRAAAEGIDCTDDAELWARMVGEVAWCEGNPANRKITYAADLTVGGSATLRPSAIRVGQGWDLHRLVPGRRLMLGGVDVPSELGEDAHSDGDVLLHAAIDALLGAAALGDIGTHFPPSEERWKDADSRALAREAASLVRAQGWEVGNLDCTIVLEGPKLGPYKTVIAASMAECLDIDPARISVKAKTKEGLDATGELRAVEAYVVALIERRPTSS